MAEDAPPRRKGYGSELIERALPYQLGAETARVRPDGVRCAIAMPVETHGAGTKHAEPRPDALRGRRLLVVETST